MSFLNQTHTPPPPLVLPTPSHVPSTHMYPPPRPCHPHPNASQYQDPPTRTSGSSRPFRRLRIAGIVPIRVLRVSGDGAWWRLWCQWWWPLLPEWEYCTGVKWWLQSTLSLPVWLLLWRSESHRSPVAKVVGEPCSVLRAMSAGGDGDVRDLVEGIRRDLIVTL